MSDIVETPEAMDDLPDYTILVSAPAKDGDLLPIAAEKIGGYWFLIGLEMPVPTTGLRNFFPATVVSRP